MYTNVRVREHFTLMTAKEGLLAIYVRRALLERSSANDAQAAEADARWATERL